MGQCPQFGVRVQIPQRGFGLAVAGKELSAARGAHGFVVNCFGFRRREYG